MTLVDEFRTSEHHRDIADRGTRAEVTPDTVHRLVEAWLDDDGSPDERLDACDGYVVLVSDPATGAIDSYGPFDGTAALLDAAERRQGLDDDDLTDVAVTVVRHHHPDSDDDTEPLAS
jgi:hypothetical protein